MASMTVVLRRAALLNQVRPFSRNTPRREVIHHNEANLGRVLRLTLLSPKVTEAIMMSGRQREGLEVAELLKAFPIEWDEQEVLFLK